MRYRIAVLNSAGRPRILGGSDRLNIAREDAMKAAAKLNAPIDIWERRTRGGMDRYVETVPAPVAVVAEPELAAIA
jgi:hypothetical protein